MKVATTTEIYLNEWPAQDLEAVAVCPVCSCSNRDSLYKGLTDSVFFCAPGKWQIYKCKECGSAYLDPRPTPETIGAAYANYYTHSSESFARMNVFRRLRRAVVNGYRNRKYGTSESPSLSWGYWLARLLPGQRAIVDAMMRHLPRAKPNNILLDIGCGNGDFLARAKDCGWDVEGVEVDPKAAEVARARGLDVYVGSVDVVRDLYERFDGITLCNVIEHVHDPVALLGECYKLLKPGGWIWIETPNIESLGNKRFGENWRGLEPPRHLVIFNRSSLQRLLQVAGFQAIVDMPYRQQYCTISTASEAIRFGLDPVAVRPTVRHYLKSIIPSFYAKHKLEAREFVTVMAKKGQK
jgi:2-polyprenyl-3-methyl-5-hydroxy-6-metoxy-1,4-benzoquinol methylase